MCGAKNKKERPFVWLWKDSQTFRTITIIASPSSSNLLSPTSILLIIKLNLSTKQQLTINKNHIF